MNQKESDLSSIFCVHESPLLRGIFRVQNRIVLFKEKVKEFYFRVLLGRYECPKCDEEITMTGPTQCSCSSGHTFDPTLEFQQSPCCNAKLVRRTFHYACSRCHQTVPSRFLFDERLFDKAYFREMMQEARTRERRKREELKLLMAGSRSDTLMLTEEPVLESIEGLTEALDGFVGINIDVYEISKNSDFNMDSYRDHILSILGMGARLFSDIPHFVEDSKKDKIWRFVTLIFMQQSGNVSLTQYGPDILVERVGNETYC